MKTYKERVVGALGRDGSDRWLVGLYMTQILVRVPKDENSLGESFSMLKKLITVIIHRNCGIRPEEVTIHLRKGIEANSFKINTSDGFTGSYSANHFYTRA